MANWVTIRRAVRHVPIKDSDALSWLRRHGLVCEIDTGNGVRLVVDLEQVDAVIRGQKRTRPRRQRLVSGTAGGALSWDDL